ncbi:hypothetical protein TNCV_3410361 [Trichonephila clavipes]|nr:hypothetical protein TNCV_3410361 [Trichonephila clavipes]
MKEVVNPHHTVTRRMQWFLSEHMDSASPRCNSYWYKHHGAKKVLHYSQDLKDLRGIFINFGISPPHKCFPLYVIRQTVKAGSDVVQSGRPIFDDFFQHLWTYIGNNTVNIVFQMVKRLWLIRIDQ